MNFIKKFYIEILSVIVILFSLYLHHCNKKTFLPKPFGHIYLTFPKHEYQKVDDKRLAFRFEMSKYAELDFPKEYKKFWSNVVYPNLDPNFQARIEMTYENLNNNEKKLRSILDDCYKLAMKHHVRATTISQDVITTKKGLQIMLVVISGEVPTSFQFYTLNSKKHFLRGALYFPTAMANDYLAPVINYIKTDIYHMISTIEWKD